MPDVDLNDLKIKHEPTGAHKSFSWLLILLALAAGIVIGLAIMKYWPRQDDDRPVKTALNTDRRDPVSSDPVAATASGFTEGGWIEVPSYHPIVVSSLIPGRVEELEVLEGSRVEKGDVIARLYAKDKEDALVQAEAEAAAALANMERLKAGFRVQEVEKARADLEAAEANTELKKKVFERTRGLLESGAVSAEDLDRDEAAYRTAAARSEALRQEFELREEGSRVEDIRAAEAEYRRRLALLELARNQLAYTTVTSPASGVVLERFVTPGTTISAGNLRIVSLYDPADLQVRVDVRQENIGGVFIGQKVEVFTDVEPGRSYAGEVIRIEPMADFKKNTIQVKVRLRDTSDKLFPEMIARIRFKEKEATADDGIDG
jgi:HlyD family secretion protein